MKILSGDQKCWRARKKERRKIVEIKKNYKYCFKNEIPALYVI